MLSDAMIDPPERPRGSPARRRAAARASLNRLHARVGAIIPPAPEPARPGRAALPSLQDLRRLWAEIRHTRLIVHSSVLLLALAMVAGERWFGLSALALSTQRDGPPSYAAGTGSLTALDADSAITLQSAALAPGLTLVSVSQAVERRDIVAPAFSQPLAISDLFQAAHAIAPGERLGDVAAQYGVTLETLIWANGLERGDALRAGQLLRIPRVSGLPYVVAEGDTSATIAERLGVAPEAFLLFGPNGLSAGAPLQPGMQIYVPGGAQPLPEALLALFGGREGLSARSAVPAGVVLAAETNVREGPGTDYGRVVQLEAGRQVELLARHEDWLKVTIGGSTGWMRADLLSADPEAVAGLAETDDFPPPPPRWVWPARGTLTSGFGPRWGSFHNGIDIANRAWTPIVAARSGWVREAGWCRGYGYCVKLGHPGGVETIYGHLVTEPVVSAGEEVTVGQLIGHMGSTYDRAGGGYSTGVHLHFTILVNGKAVNPLRFLP